ncbi:MAG: hypothetical protein D6714_04025, partial [Bacteroidetes bacterium]
MSFKFDSDLFQNGFPRKAKINLLPGSQRAVTAKFCGQKLEFFYPMFFFKSIVLKGQKVPN